MIPAPTDGEYLWDEESESWIPVKIDKYGFPLTEQKKEQLRQYKSWIWDDDLLEWVPPTPKPEDIFSDEYPEFVDFVHIWDDDLAEWVPVSTKPYPSWIRSSEGYWVSPIPIPTLEFNEDGIPKKNWEWNEDSQSWQQVV